MKFPKVIPHRKAECKIYGKKPRLPILPRRVVCDRPHVDAFIKAMIDASRKARNHHRGGIKQFIRWSVRNP